MTLRLPTRNQWQRLKRRAFQIQPDKTYLTYLPDLPSWPTNLTFEPTPNKPFTILAGKSDYSRKRKRLRDVYLLQIKLKQILIAFLVSSLLERFNCSETPILRAEEIYYFNHFALKFAASTKSITFAKVTT